MDKIHVYTRAGVALPTFIASTDLVELRVGKAVFRLSAEGEALYVRTSEENLRIDPRADNAVILRER